MTKNKSLDNELTLMVALDLTRMDPILLQYVSYLCDVWKVKHLYFTHNIKQSKLYNLYEDFLKDDITIEDIVERELERSIKENYSGKASHTVLITSDNYTESILVDLAKEYNVDVVVMGKKDELQGTGALPQKLVRMMKRHLLLVPEDARHSLRKMLVPVDFSSNSAKAFTVANSISSDDNKEIEALHVYNIPSFYFPYIDTQKAKDKTKAHLHARFDQYRKKHRLSADIKFLHIDREENSVVDIIEREAEKGEFDIILMSARGGNNITSLFIGSITNDLLLRNRTMPLLVVK
ncbi:universal stress protein [Arenibacter latericius]|uniref:universal stress protein n=1 Tax=Arenibacter latericius TaxID=86104 RepID=UPI000478F374|nr:universal stress protein [Arenibacter latericius]MDX1362984.1 universal stress protein [Arenibacter latericius]